MGGSPPSSSVTVMPSPTTPTIYKSVIPLESYQQTAEYLNRIQEQTNQVREEMYAQSGTPAEIGARKAGTETQAAASYLASIPKGDKYSRRAAGTADPYSDARDAAQENLSQAQQNYAKALQNINAKPEEIKYQTPSWATSTTT